MSEKASEKPAIGSIHAIMGLHCPIKVVDIGANPIDDSPPYLTLLRRQQATVVGFEPNLTALAELEAKKGPLETYLPYAIGDGNTHTLHQCFAPGMTSLLEPNLEVLNLFHYFNFWAEVKERAQVETKRLDDVPETEGMHLLKIDIQGAEMMVFENAIERLKTTLVVHTEVEFMQMYKGQALFSDIDQFLRQHGFQLHKFSPIKSRTLAPVHPYAGYNQLLWGDAIFMRDLTKLDALSPEQILRQAVILHECYGSYDVAYYLIRAFDARTGSTIGEAYGKAIEEAQMRLAFRHDSHQHDH